jgi:hypothetical protein
VASVTSAGRPRGVRRPATGPEGRHRVARSVHCGPTPDRYGYRLAVDVTGSPALLRALVTACRDYGLIPVTVERFS